MPKVGLDQEGAVLVMNPGGLVMLLRDFARRLGMDASMAEAIAKVHLAQIDFPQVWSAFLISNCARCAESPETCRQLNPTAEDCAPGQDPWKLKLANQHLIAAGRTTVCPRLQESRISDVPGDVSPGEE